jgi:TRAP transporter TAXI family solute receptor
MSIAQTQSKEVKSDKEHPFGLRTVMDLFDISPVVAITALAITIFIIALATFYFLHSAPPTQITISTGPEGSAYQKNAIKYQKILEQNGVKVNVLTSEGSLQNLQRLTDNNSKVDVAFVQAGVTSPGVEKLMSLGSVSYQPLMIFYQGKPMQLISELAGKRIAIGPDGSGARKFALAILNANGIKENDSKTRLLDWEGEEAAKALGDGKLDAAFVMSENASIDILHNLLHSKNIRLYSFKQAVAYSRKIEFLNLLELPEGSIDFGQNIPGEDVHLLGPMVELIAKNSLHPALADLLLEAATQVHNHPGIYQKRGEFPSPIEHAIHISEDARRFHQSGKTWLYRMFPFWIASLLSRLMLVFLPTLVVLIPALRSIPAFFRWKMQMKLRKHYRDLLTLEQEFLFETNPQKQDMMRHKFDRIEKALNKMKVSPAFADQFYSLRGHVDFVRQLVSQKAA